MGLSKEVPEKPEILALYEQIENFNTLLLPGGVIDQPYIFMQELHTAIRAKKQFQDIKKQNKPPPG